MATATVEQEIIDLEKEYWKAIRDKDEAAAARLTNDPCIITGAQGVANIDRKMYSKMLHSSQWTLSDYHLGDDMTVRMLTDDVAVIAYTVTEQLIVEGKPLTLEAADASTWVKRDGRWLCALHTESLTGDPFGQDRTATRRT